MTTGKPGILVTRPVHQAQYLVSLIEQKGWRPVCFPVLEIVPVANLQPVKIKLQQLNFFDAIIFTSANAVNFALQANSGKIDPFKHHRIAAIGQATAKVLLSVGLKVDLLPNTGFNSEALLALPELLAVRGRKFLIVRGEGGLEDLGNHLKMRGALVEYLEVYKRIKPACDNREVLQLLRHGGLDVITVTSGEGLHNLIKMLGEPALPKVLSIPLVVVSERIKAIAKAMNFRRVMVADSPGDAAVLEKITTLID